jgi:hypothetical protein
MAGQIVAKPTAVVGVWDHWGWAVLVTVQPGGELLDRRRVTLIEEGLPPYPHHHDGQSLAPERAVALVKRVQASVRRCARVAIAALAGDLRTPIGGIAIRACPALPPTIAERISDYRAHNVADSVMYRQALAEAAAARRWFVSWYEARLVEGQAARALGKRAVRGRLDAPGEALGPPWTKDHRLAMAAALAAGEGGRP